MTQIWAHRGASAEAPENTLPAFELAIAQDADGFELDVQRSADGVLVVCHDETIDRTSDGTGAIVDLDLAALRRHDFSNAKPGFAQVVIPTLAEVLDLVRGSELVVNIELKDSIEPYAGMAAQALALVDELGLADQVWFSSFNHHTLVELIALGAQSPCGVLYEEKMVEPWRYAAGFGAAALHPMALTVDAELVASAHLAGLKVHPWTVDAPEHVRALAAVGVDAIITNRPAQARSALG